MTRKQPDIPNTPEEFNNAYRDLDTGESLHAPITTTPPGEGKCGERLGSGALYCAFDSAPPGHKCSIHQ